MNSPTVIYDAQADGMAGLSSPVILAAVIAVGAAFIAMNPAVSRRGDPNIIRVGAILAFVASSAIVLASVYRSGIFASTSASFVAYEGCVADLDTATNRNAHNLKDTTFRVGAKTFHFNSSPWLRGFHNENDDIAEGERLRLTERGGEVTKIVRLGSRCAV